MLALGIIILIGMPVAWWLSQATGRKRLIGELLVMIPLLTPPLAMGILLVSAFGPYGVFGRWLSLLGATLVNNPAAFVLAQVYGALPYFIVVSRSAFATVPKNILEAGQTLGASPTEPLSFSYLTPGIAWAGFCRNTRLGSRGRRVRDRDDLCLFPAGYTGKAVYQSAK